MSVSGYALRELIEIAKRADNPGLLGDLPDLGVDAADVLADLEGAIAAVMVVDASVAILGLLNDGDSRRTLASEDLAVPHLADSEVAHTLRAQVLRGSIPAEDAERALTRWALLGIRRFPSRGLLGRIRELRNNLSAYDATYVAHTSVVTAESRLANAAGPRCPITVIRN